MDIWLLTDAFEFLFQEGHVVTLRDPEVEFRIVLLEDEVGGVGSSNCKDSGWTLSFSQHFLDFDLHLFR